jgi:hypothetical protein
MYLMIAERKSSFKPLLIDNRKTSSPAIGKKKKYPSTPIIRYDSDRL